MSENTINEQDYTKRFDFSLWKKVIKLALRQKRTMFWLALSMIAVAGIDALFPMLNRWIIDKVIIGGHRESLLPLMGLNAAFIIFQAANVCLFIHLAGLVETGLNYYIRQKGYQKLMELSFSYYDKTPVGWLIARLTSDISRLGDIVAWGLVDVVWGVMVMLFVTGLMFYMSWKLALIVLLTAPILVWVSSKFHISILRSYREVRKTNSQITGAYNEGINGARTTKTLVREDANLQEFELHTDKMYRSSVKAAVLSSLYLPLVLIIGNIGMAMVLWYGGVRVQNQAVTYGTLIAFISYAAMFFEPISNLARIFAEMQNAQAAAERVFSMIETEADIKDTSDVITDESLLNKTLEGSVEFRNVGFAYKEGVHVLEDFSLTINPGETIALVGETGSGKSTIVNLICRFYQPTSGEILIDGIDYRRYPLRWLQAHLGYVLQTPHLFSGTIGDNIRYGRLSATDAEIEEAARLVSAHDFIMQFENGYNTEVGEGGNLLSTGQKQLISFARAIIADPRFFILDEATSSVDTETEVLIQHAIEKVLEGRTSFIIAHRLSTIRSADRILVIDHGKVIESGTHQQLLRLKGYYYRLYTNQFLEEKEVEILAG